MSDDELDRRGRMGTVTDVSWADHNLLPSAREGAVDPGFDHNSCPSSASLGPCPGHSPGHDVNSPSHALRVVLAALEPGRSRAAAAVVIAVVPAPLGKLQRHPGVDVVWVQSLPV